MPQVYKLLGRANPSASSPTIVYTAPLLTTVLVSSILVTNTGSADDSIQIFFVPALGAAGPSNAIIWNLVIPVGNPYAANVVPILAPGDFIVVESANGNCTFTISGLEIS